MLHLSCRDWEAHHNTLSLPTRQCCPSAVNHTKTPRMENRVAKSKAGAPVSGHHVDLCVVCQVTTPESQDPHLSKRNSLWIKYGTH